MTTTPQGHIDVPAKLARRVRMLSTGHGRKTDQADALSVGIAAHTATRRNTAAIDEAIAAPTVPQQPPKSTEVTGHRSVRLTADTIGEHADPDGDHATRPTSVAERRWSTAAATSGCSSG
ncbi:hypothetical protein [Micromonospora sp. KC207]|uniref:hypothetical protein n=1 Tax=Micromonospora sp. KC207 TaxID=2530377 RepID=UPI001A9CD380|nr:hypothetical protein [Micromonospora sp. KC207]